MNDKAFISQKEEALRRMREMNKKSQPQPQEPAPKATNPDNSFLSGLNIPFLEKLKSDGDSTLILGILLLLLSEKADKKLLFALIYILL